MSSQLFNWDERGVTGSPLTCVAMPAWSHPGTHNTLYPCILLLMNEQKSLQHQSCQPSQSIGFGSRQRFRIMRHVLYMLMAFTIEPGRLLWLRSERGPGAACRSRLVGGCTERRSDPQHERISPEKTFIQHASFYTHIHSPHR